MRRIGVLAVWLFGWALFAASNSQIVSVNSPLSMSSGVISIPKAGASTNGYLSSTDWSRFNSGIGSAGTVTSVGLSLPNIFSVSNSPVTTSGTLTATLASQTGNQVLASPDGTSGSPSFRALTTNDIPTLNQNTTGTALNVTGTVAISHGGTGQVSQSAAFNALSPMTALGDTVYGGASGTGTALAGNTSATKKFLTQTGNGSVSAAPAWNTISASDLPNPTSTTLGGIESYAAVTNQWINAISTSGVPSSAQPAFSNLSGSVASTQMPALTGDVTTSAGAVATTVAKIQTVTVSGTTGTGNVVFSASPTLTGTAVLASATVSGSVVKGNYHIEPVVSAVGNCGTAVTLDLSTANVFTITLNSASACVWTMSNPQDGAPYGFILTQNASGNGTVTFPGTFIFSGGSPTLTASNAAIDKITCLYSSTATKYYCDAALNYH